ncbi:MAG: LD-carboxypeptidase [Bacteroidetes bacterium]|nr:MAG: LD-carboxypeptidase [Bacteroidota bacterium]
MTTPNYLSKGDKIGIVSTARKITESEIAPCISRLESWGLEVVLGDNLFKKENQFAGSDQDRVRDMQSMINDASVKAIICARGGYGTVRIVDTVDYSQLTTSPKWLIGFSDVTVMHSHIHANFGLATLHGPMAINFGDSESLEELKKALFGEELVYAFSSQKLNRRGTCEGDIIGGNLSLLYSLMASNSQMDTRGKILFLEDLDEHLYHIDRMMQNLNRAGYLEHLSGLLIGGMTNMNDNDIAFGATCEEIIAETVSDYDYPVAYGFSAGHMKKNLPLILGAQVELVVEDSGSNLRFL